MGSMDPAVLDLPWKPRELDLNLEIHSYRTTLAHSIKGPFEAILACKDHHLERLSIGPPVILGEEECGSYHWLISQLPHLQAFRMRRYANQSPPDRRFLKPNLSLLARLLEFSPQSLRYLKVHTWAWRVIRDLDSGRAVGLEGMDAFEQAEIQLFLDYPFHTAHTPLLNLNEGVGFHVGMTSTLHWKDIHDFDLAKFYSEERSKVTSDGLGNVSTCPCDICDDLEHAIQRLGIS